MRSMRSLSLLALAFPLLCGAAAMAQAVAPSVRIVNPIDENDLVTLAGNTHPLADAKTDRGRVSPDLPMTDLILVLSRSPEQQAAFDKFVESQYTPGSPNFHQWLTPEQVGIEFGPSMADIATISNWLTGHGFSIGEVTKDRLSIRFSGTAEQAESTFHTEIHNLEVRGIQHIGNMSDPRIPAALTPTVIGVKSLHDFFARPLHRTGNIVTRNSQTGKWLRPTNASAESTVNAESVAGNAKSRPSAPRPQFGISVPAGTGTNAYLVEDVVPYDFATIYNVLPLWNASTPIDGAGQTIAIAGTSDIVLSDVTTFRSTFGLPAYTSADQPTVISGNKQPLTVCPDSAGLCTVDDLIENTLDVEWSGSIAKGANIVLVASYPASSSDDALYDSESYIVQNKTANIMNVSYGGCELFQGTAGNVEYYNLWQSASSEGIAVFVSSGDGGSAECDDGASIAAGNPYSAQYGLAVNGLASTPYNTAVGGTDFNWCSLASTTECTAAPYWNSTNAANGSSAIGYVPEVPWDDTCANPLTVTYLENWATSTDAGNVGGVTDPESGCNFVYKNWQTVNTGSGGANLSFFVDTVGGGGGASGCVVNDGNTVASCAASTTTTGTANGSITLVKDGWPKPSWQTGVAGIPSDGVRDLPDVSFFASDGYVSSSAYLICVSAVASCTYSTTSEPTSLEVGGTSVSSPAMAGVMALIDQKAGKAQGNPNAALYALASKQTYSDCVAEKTTNSNGCYFNDIDSGTTAVPCDYGATEGNPATAGILSPDCTAAHSGDLVGILPSYSAGVGYDQATGLGSLNVANVVNAWPGDTAAGTAAVTVTVTATPTTLPVNSALSVAVTVASTPSGGATPTGTVALSGSYTSSAETLSSGAYTFTIPANSLTAGTDALTVRYSGDSTYSTEIGATTVTVTGATSGSGTFTLSATTPASVAPGTSATSTITVSESNSYVGTATLSCSLTTSSPSSVTDAPSCSLSSSTVSLTSSATSGTVTATVTSTAATTSQFARPDPHHKGREWMGVGSGAVLAFLVFLGIPARRRSWRSMLGAAVLIVALGGMAGCGDFWQAPAGNTAGGTTAGTYTFTVSGTGDPTVTAVSTTFVVTVN
jgi:hypothetical protein